MSTILEDKLHAMADRDETQRKQVDKSTANIDYVAMMCDVELPPDEEESNA